MADYAEKGFVAVAMNPEDHPKCQDPPPPYSGRPEVGQSAPPYVLQPYPAMSSCHLDTVQLTVPAVLPPKDYVLWSLFSAMFCNTCCLGFVALLFSVKSRDRMVMKDVAAARRYGDIAQRLNLAAVTVGIIIITFFMLKVGLRYWSS